MLQESTSHPQRRLSDPGRAEENFDPVTGVGDRELLRKRAEQDWERAQRSKQRVTIIMLSIDHYREYRGEAATICKRAVSEVIVSHCRRRADFAGRMRDHEFAVLLSNATRHGARMIAESICRDVEAQNIRTAAPDRVLTVSAGIGSMVPRPTRFVDSLLIAADSGLRKARRMGGNNVQISTKLR